VLVVGTVVGFPTSSAALIASTCISCECCLLSDGTVVVVLGTLTAKLTPENLATV
jgi:hypothetical protein